MIGGVGSPNGFKRINLLQERKEFDGEIAHRWVNSEVWNRTKNPRFPVSTPMVGVNNLLILLELWELGRLGFGGWGKGLIPEEVAYPP